jgi:hypothetical protein
MPRLSCLVCILFALIAMLPTGCNSEPRALANYAYVKDGTNELQLLSDEKVVRTVPGVVNVKTSLQGGRGLIVISAEPEHDIDAREKLLSLGYQRRW